MTTEYKRPAPSVTLVLVCYNQEKYIKEAVLSALHQDHSPLKIIISDDCSKDNNNGNYKRHLRRHNGYIFKHFKISEIKNNINIINGEVIS